MLTDRLSILIKNNMDINITDSAAHQLASIPSKNEALRLAIQGGGCAGFEYKFGIIPIQDIGEDDYVIQKLDAKVYVDVISSNYLQGVVIDWIEDLMGSGFKINNPNVKSTCGCGSSFS